MAGGAQIALGKQGMQSSRMGLGCMGIGLTMGSKDLASGLSRRPKLTRSSRNRSRCSRAEPARPSARAAALALALWLRFRAKHRPADRARSSPSQVGCTHLDTAQIYKSAVLLLTPQWMEGFWTTLFGARFSESLLSPGIRAAGAGTVQVATKVSGMQRVAAVWHKGVDQEPVRQVAGSPAGEMHRPVFRAPNRPAGADRGVDGGDEGAHR